MGIFVPLGGMVDKMGVMMDVRDDRELVEAYAARRGTARGEAAFAELVRRHVDMVYAAARRRTRAAGESHLADDVTQAVFVLLAQRAGRIGRGVSVSGWLYEATRYAAANAVRGERRRRKRERVAAAERNEDMTRRDDQEVNWEEAGPVVDAAMARLGRADREAIVLRFLQGKTSAEVGRAMGTTEDAAKQRVLRAMRRLREILGEQQKGAAWSAAGVVTALESHGSAGAAPAAVRAAAMRASAGAGGKAAAIAGGASQMMWWAKAKVAVAVIAGVTAAGVGGTVAVRHWQAAPVATTALGAGEAGTPEPEPNSPKGALLKAYRAGWAGDREAVRAMVYTANADEARVADAFATMFATGGEMTRAMRERWPNDPQIESRDVVPFCKSAERAIAKAAETFEGDRAKLTIEGMGPMFVTKEGGKWQLWGASMAFSGESRADAASKAARMEFETAALRDVVAEIRSGKFAAPRDATAAYKARVRGKGPGGPATRK